MHQEVKQNGKKCKWRNANYRNQWSLLSAYEAIEEELHPSLWPVSGNVRKGFSNFCCRLRVRSKVKNKIGVHQQIRRKIHIHRGARQLGTGTYFPYHRLPLWLKIFYTSSTVFSISGSGLPSGTITHPLASLPSKHFRLNSHFLSYLIEASTIKSRLEWMLLPFCWLIPWMYFICWILVVITTAHKLHLKNGFRYRNIECKAGIAPTVEDSAGALKSHDLFIYIGHGSGAQHIPRHWDSETGKSCCYSPNGMQ